MKQNKLSNVAIKALYLFLSIIIYPSLPFVILFFLPIWLLRKLAIFLSRFNPDLVSALSLDSCLTVVDEIYSKPHAIIVPVIFVNGELSLEKFQDRMIKVAERFPELKCHLGRWMFSYFWRKCGEDVEIRDQVSQNNASSKDEFRNVLEGLATKPFKRGRPLWEIVIFPYYKDPEKKASSAYALRIHHCLADGFATNSLVKGIEDPNTDLEDALKEMKKKLKSRIKQNLGFWYYFQLIVIMPAYTVYKVFIGFDSNAWTLPDSRRSWTVVHEESEPFELDWVKKIAKLKGRGMTAVMVEAFTATMRNILMEQGVKDIKDFYMTYPWPKPGHPGTLTNHVAGLPILAPVSVRGREERLKIIAQEFQQWASTPYGIGFTLGQQAYALLVNFTNTGLLGTGHYSTLVLTNFMFVSKAGRNGKIFGNEVTNLNILSGIQVKNNALLCGSFSFNGKMKVVMKGDTTLFDKQTAKRLVQNVVEELKKMEDEGLNVVSVV